MTRHQTFSFPSALPEGRRRAALELQVRKAFPFRDPRFAAVWKGHEATVYAWEHGPVKAALDAAGAPRSTQVLPETFMRPKGEDQTRLVAMLEGCEGQVWRGGFLIATRWWPAPPPPAEWTRFLRLAGQAADPLEAPPRPTQIDFLERPWTEGVFSLEEIAQFLQTRRAMGMAAALVLCPFVLLGTEIAVTGAATSRIRAELASLADANQDLRRDRAAAYDNVAAIEDFIKLDPFPHQVDVLGNALTLLKPSNVRVLSWSFDRGSLEIIVRGAQELDPTAYITMFERDPFYEGVSGTLVGQERDLQLRMTVTPRASSGAVG